MTDNDRFRAWIGPTAQPGHGRNLGSVDLKKHLTLEDLQEQMAGIVVMIEELRDYHAGLAAAAGVKLAPAWRNRPTAPCGCHLCPVHQAAYIDMAAPGLPGQES